MWFPTFQLRPIGIKAFLFSLIYFSCLAEKGLAKVQAHLEGVGGGLGPFGHNLDTCWRERESLGAN